MVRSEITTWKLNSLIMTLKSAPLFPCLNDVSRFSTAGHDANLHETVQKTSISCILPCRYNSHKLQMSSH